MRSIFGWSYPPGCSGPPDDDWDCEVCGEPTDNCICPECPVCEDIGNPDCYVNHGLKRTEVQKFLLECSLRRLVIAIFKENEYVREFYSWRNNEHRNN